MKRKIEITRVATHSPRAAYTIAEFCETHRLSRSALYQTWKDGTGPRRMMIGSKVLVSVEAAVEWRRAREAATGPSIEGSSYSQAR
jgi:predicted DNA-binding transcriptional regulator AlpA